MVMGILELVAGSRLMTGPTPPPPRALGATAGSSCDRAPGMRAPATASLTLVLMKSRRDSSGSFFGSSSNQVLGGGVGAPASVSVMELHPPVRAASGPDSPARLRRSLGCNCDWRSLRSLNHAVAPPR